MGDPVTATSPAARPAVWWALPVAATVVATGLLWDPASTTYGALKYLALALGALATALTAAQAASRGTGWDLGRPLLPAAGLAALGGTSLLWTPSWATGLQELLPLFAALTLLIAGRVLLQSDAQARLLGFAIAASGMLVAVGTITERLTGGLQLRSTIGNPNYVAAYLAASMPYGLWLCLAIQSTGPTRMARGGRLAAQAAVATPLLITVWLTGCRSAWLALAAGGVVAWSLYRPTRRGRVLALGTTSALCLIGGGALLALTAWRAPTQGRLYLARISLRLMAERPMTGQGVGGFATRFPSHQAAHLAKRPNQRQHWSQAQTAHCEPLQLLVELGVAGGLLLAGLIVVLLGAMLGGRGPPTPRRVAAAASLTVLAVVSLAEGSLHNVALLTLAAVGAALLLIPNVAPRRGNEGLVGVLLVLSSSAGVVTATRHYAADRLLGRAHLAATASQRLILLERSGRLAINPGRARFYQGLALSELGRPAAAVRALRLSTTDFSNLGTHVALGNALAAQGRNRSAATAYTRAIWLNPRYATAHHNLGLTLLRLGHERRGRRSLRRARRLRPGRWLEPWRIRLLKRARNSGHRRMKRTGASTTPPTPPAPAHGPAVDGAR